MDHESVHRAARRSAVRRRGHVLLELAVVKFVSLALGGIVICAIDPVISKVDARLLTAMEIDVNAEGGPAAPDLDSLGHVTRARSAMDDRIVMPERPRVRRGTLESDSTSSGSELPSGDGNPVEAAAGRFEIAAVGE